jgi:hypothetical protein
MGDSIAAGDGDPVAGYADRSWAERLADVLEEVDGTATHLNLRVRGLRSLNGLVRRVTARHGGIHVDCFDHPALDADGLPGHTTTPRTGEGRGKALQGG